MEGEGATPIEAMVSVPLIAHDYPTLVAAAERGLGLAQVPRPVVAAALAEGRLQSVLDDVAGGTPGLFLYHPGPRQVAPKLRAFIDHVRARR